MMQTAEADSVGWDAHCKAFLKFEYLGKIETECENILACLSGAHMGS